MADDEKNDETTQDGSVSEAEAPAEEPEPVAEVEEPPAEEAPGVEEPPAEAPAEEGPAEEAPASDGDEPAAVAAPARKAKPKRRPRSERRQRSRPKRERPETRKPIARLPKPEHVRGRRQERRGIVVSSAMDKTIVVKVETVKAHSKYKKVIRRSRKFHAHDEQNVANVGDVVLIAETRPLSAMKNWRLVEVLEAAK
ncbi:MAG: 30S ribosomal protein S17 [Gaiellaceae bacterium]